jgi:hypothetical protein
MVSVRPTADAQYRAVRRPPAASSTRAPRCSSDLTGGRGMRARERDNLGGNWERPRIAALGCL